MNHQTIEIEPEDRLEALTCNFGRQLTNPDLKTEEKIDALIGNVRGVAKLDQEFVMSVKGRRAIGVALTYFSASLPNDDTIALPVKAAIVAAAVRTQVALERHHH